MTLYVHAECVAYKSIMLSVLMSSVVVLSVVAPAKVSLSSARYIFPTCQVYIFLMIHNFCFLRSEGEGEGGGDNKLGQVSLGQSYKTFYAGNLRQDRDAR